VAAFALILAMRYCSEGGLTNKGPLQKDYPQGPAALASVKQDGLWRREQRKNSLQCLDVRVTFNDVTFNANAIAAAKLDLDDASPCMLRRREGANCGAPLEIGPATGVISTGTRASAASPPSRPWRLSTPSVNSNDLHSLM
jgi:hypothetical protein